MIPFDAFGKISAQANDLIHIYLRSVEISYGYNRFFLHIPSTGYVAYPVDNAIHPFEQLGPGNQVL